MPKLAIAAAAALLLAAGAAHAGLGGATGNARVMALIGPAGAVIRSKGVASVTRPSTGRYCIKPSDSTVNPDTLVPTVSIDITGTHLNDSIVQLRSTRFPSCPAGTFEVRTLARTLGQDYGPSDQVQFSFVAP